MENHSRLKHFMQLVCFIIFTATTACVPASPTATDTPIEGTPTVETPVITATLEPTATNPAPTVVLIHNADTDPALLSEIQSTTSTLAGQGELAFASYEGLAPEILTPNVRVVVVVGLGVDLNSLAPSNPEITFVSINNPETVPANNVFVIGDPSARQERHAFMAGYLTAVISSDYKVGGLFSSETSADIVNAFVIGAEFFCGICRPSYPPYNSFPYWDFLSPGSSVNGFQSIVDNLVLYGVEVLYLQGDLVSSELLSYLAEVGIKVVSDSPPDLARNNWVGTVEPNPSAVLSEIWEDILGDAEGVLIPAPVTLMDMEAGLVSEGRLRLFEEMAAALDAGLVSTQYVP